MSERPTQVEAGMSDYLINKLEQISTDLSTLVVSVTKHQENTAGRMMRLEEKITENKKEHFYARESRTNIFKKMEENRITNDELHHKIERQIESFQMKPALDALSSAESSKAAIKTQLIKNGTNAIVGAVIFMVLMVTGIYLEHTLDILPANKTEIEKGNN